MLCCIGKGHIRDVWKGSVIGRGGDGGGGKGKCCMVPEVIAAHDQGIKVLVLSLVANKMCMLLVATSPFRSSLVWFFSSIFK